MSESRGGRTGFALLGLLAPFAAGAFLRLYRLSEQVLGGDELHAVWTALKHPVGDILFTYRASDPCLPLTALYRFAMDLGLTFSETTFRLPILAAGLASLLIMPRLVEPLVGRRASWIFAWLLALSPMMVLYSRIVRSYALVNLLCFAALVVFYRWLERPSREPPWKGAAVYATLAAAAIYAHLVAAPLMAAPFVFAGVEKLVAGRRGGAFRGFGGSGRIPRWRDLFVAGGLALGAVAAFMLPSWPSLRHLIGVKAANGYVSASTLVPIAKLQAGTAVTALAVIFWGLAAVGIAGLFVRQRRFALFLATVFAVHLAGIAALQPPAIQQPLILNRYLLVATPFLLLAVAQALTSPKLGSRKLERWLSHPVAAAVFLGVLFLGGPFTEKAYRTTSFLHHNDFFRLDAPRARLPAAPPAAFYRHLRDAPGEEPILELPALSPWRFARSFYVHQEVHGRPVIVGGVEVQLCDPRLRLVTRKCLHPDQLLASGARFVLVHLDPDDAEASLIVSEARRDRRPWRWEVATTAAANLARRLESAWGPPGHRDDELLVWDLEAARRASPPGERKTPQGPAGSG